MISGWWGHPLHDTIIIPLEATINPGQGVAGKGLNSLPPLVYSLLGYIFRNLLKINFFMLGGRCISGFLPPMHFPPGILGGLADRDHVVGLRLLGLRCHPRIQGDTQRRASDVPGRLEGEHTDGLQHGDDLTLVLRHLGVERCLLFRCLGHTSSCGLIAHWIGIYFYPFIYPLCRIT